MAIIDIFVFAAGVTLGVWYHDMILKWWLGAEAFAAKLEATFTAIKAKLGK